MVGPGSVAATAGDASFGRLVFVAAVFAAVVAACIVAFGRLSGSHINPAVTAAVAVRERTPAGAVATYLGAQLLAGLAAGATLSLLFARGAGSAHLGSTSLAPAVSEPVGLALEAAGTFVLAMAALNAGRLTASGRGQAAVVGTTLFLLIVALGPLTGASFNPARSLGPALFDGTLDGLGVFIAGPILGGALAALLTRALAPEGRA